MTTRSRAFHALLIGRRAITWDVPGFTAAMIEHFTAPFTGRGTFLHPIFGRLDSRGAYALLAFHLRLHVPQIRRSIEINGRS